MGLHLALPYLVATKGKEGVQLSSAETDSSNRAPVRHREDDLSRAVIGAHLNARARRDEHLALLCVANRLRASIVLPIGDVQPEETLLVGQRSVGVDLIAV